MSRLATVLPELVAEMSEVLLAAGRGDLVPQLADATIARCTYDAGVDAGYIYLACATPRRRPGSSSAAPVAETIPFLDAGFNVDLDRDGNVFGVELLSRSDVFARLQQARRSP